MSHTLKVTLINRSDLTGGAAVVTLRLTEALREAGVDARMLVVEKRSDLEYVEKAAPETRCKIPFIAERIGILCRNGFNRNTLFKIDTAEQGLPLWKHPLVTQADAVCLNWVNQGMLSLNGIRKISKSGKPIIWTMHDMWNLTGVCHHAGICHRYMEHCGKCPLLGHFSYSHDLSDATFRRKNNTYATVRPTFVAVSHWLRDLAAQSLLLRDMPLHVIPNAFPTEKYPAPADITAWRREAGMENPGRFIIAMGAARIDDPVKGFPILVEATKALRRKQPRLADSTMLLTFGDIRDPEIFHRLDVNHTHLGRISGKEVTEVMRKSHAVVSSSLYETLPGTLVEGQAAGAIPVSFNRGGQGDIIQHKATGYIAEISDDIATSAERLADGLIWAAHQGDTLSRILAQNVREKFAAATVASRYINLIESLLHKSGK